ncbi:RNA methyltransferase, TrmH family [Mariniphaga anaerophila]|uniref:RNA methyltransferase, TrmH family n=1 Tax=Mariniphaga anaerophila TaxID=1484053 RepID=A0A1M5DAA9_9BACT|nr:RNA methyltransferase [Mariniphaga anaerophila]SHF63926.1 RNA methyltransferase, TrmH family [Mariniphaga anaerophila]
MIGKNKIKQIKSLTQKKFRLKEESFLVEGDKNIREVLKSHFRVKELFATAEFISENKSLLPKAEKVTETSAAEIKKASLLKQPQNCLAVCELPHQTTLPQNLDGFCFFLDGVQDPGNLGTIIRTCDWFGVKYLFCSPDTADVFNPKVIQATMGSFTRVKVIYTPFDALALLANEQQLPVFGTFLEGENIYSTPLPGNAIIILGNEGKGIREEVAKHVTFKLNIPSFGQGKEKAESLNVAVTSGIICSEFSRNKALYSK